MHFEEAGVDYTAKVTIEIPDITFTYNISMIDRTSLKLRFKFSEDVVDKTAVLRFIDDGYYFSSLEGAKLDSNKAIVKINDFIFYTDL